MFGRGKKKKQKENPNPIVTENPIPTSEIIQPEEDAVVENTLDVTMELEYKVSLPEICGIDAAKVHGIGARENQEDSFGISEIDEELWSSRGILFVLADGMGGMEGGEKASMAAVISCLNYFDEEDPSLGSDWMETMALRANEDVREALGELRDMGGSTLVAVRVFGDTFEWCTVGDSHLYLFRNGQLSQLNHDHVYGAKLAELVQSGDISPEDAMNHPQRKALTSYLGKAEVDEIDLSGGLLQLEKGDWLLLMSDGIFGTLLDSEIIDALHGTASWAAKSMGILIEKRRKPGQDNYTGLLINIR